jgi:hypothetical protein
MSRTTNLVPDDTNDSSDIFLRDRQTATTTRVSVGNQAFDIFVRDVVDNTTHRVSVNDAGIKGDLSSGGGDGPAISSNGAHVAFDSQATNLVPGDKNGVKDVYARINWAS